MTGVLLGSSRALRRHSLRHQPNLSSPRCRGAHDGRRTMGRCAIKLVATDLDGTLLDPGPGHRPDGGRRAAGPGGRDPRGAGHRPPSPGHLASGRRGRPGPARRVLQRRRPHRHRPQASDRDRDHRRRGRRPALSSSFTTAVPGLLLAADDLDCFTHEPGFLGAVDDWEEELVEADDLTPALATGCVKLIARVPGWSARELIAALERRGRRGGGPRHHLRAGLGRYRGARHHQGLRPRAGVRPPRCPPRARWSPSATTTTTCPSWPGPGIAMAPANAVPEVLAMVDRVLPPNSEDGVAQFLEELAGSLSARP